MFRNVSCCPETRVRQVFGCGAAAHRDVAVGPVLRLETRVGSEHILDHRIGEGAGENRGADACPGALQRLDVGDVEVVKRRVDHRHQAGIAQKCPVGLGGGGKAIGRSGPQRG
jgi:hypothetical protein